MSIDASFLSNFLSVLSEQKLSLSASLIYWKFQGVREEKVTEAL